MVVALQSSGKLKCKRNIKNKLISINSKDGEELTVKHIILGRITRIFC